MGDWVGSVLRIDGRFDRAAADYSSIEGERSFSSKGIVEAAVEEGSESRMAAAGPAGVTESALLEGAATQIPKILRTAEGKRVDVRSKRQFSNWLKKEFTENVLVIHQIEEREARIDTRGRKHLEKGSVLVVIGAAVASTAEISSTEPRLHRGVEFMSSFDSDCARPMSKHSPITDLRGAPEQEIGLGFTRTDGGEVVSPERGEANVAVIGGASGQRAIVNLQNGTAIMIFDSEEAKLTGSAFGRELPGERGIVNVDIQLVYAAKLVNAFDRTSGKKGKVVGPVVRSKWIPSNLRPM